MISVQLSTEPKSHVSTLLSHVPCPTIHRHLHPSIHNLDTQHHRSCSTHHPPTYSNNVTTPHRRARREPSLGRYRIYIYDPGCFGVALLPGSERRFVIVIVRDLQAQLWDVRLWRAGSQ